MKFCHSFKSTVWFNDAIYSLEILGNVGLGDGLVPNRRQSNTALLSIAISWTNLLKVKSKHNNFYRGKSILKISSAKWPPSYSGPNMFTCHLLKGNVVIFAKFSSLATQNIVKITTSRTASDGNLIKSDISGLVMHYSDVIMNAMVSQITSLTIAYSTVYSGADQRKQSSASLAFVRGIHRWPVNSPHKWPATRKMFPFDDAIMAREDSQLGHSAFVIQWNDNRDFYVQDPVSM